MSENISNVYINFVVNRNPEITLRNKHNFQHVIFYMNLQLLIWILSPAERLILGLYEKIGKLFQDQTIKKGMLKEKETKVSAGGRNGQILNCCREIGQKIKSDLLERKVLY